MPAWEAILSACGCSSFPQNSEFSDVERQALMNVRALEVGYKMASLQVILRGAMRALTDSWSDHHQQESSKINVNLFQTDSTRKNMQFPGSMWHIFDVFRSLKMRDS